MANRYWVGGSAGTWNTTTSWSATSGGASGASIPTSADDVFFDANSGTGTTNVPTTTIKSFSTLNSPSRTFQNLSGTLTITENVYITSSITWTVFITTMTAAATGTATLFFQTTLGTWQTISINAAGNTVNLSGNFTSTVNIDNRLVLTAGTFNTNNYNVTVGRFICLGTGVRTVNLGSSTFTVTGPVLPQWQFDLDPNLTFNAGTSTISLESTAKFNGFLGGDRTFNVIRLGGSFVDAEFYLNQIGTVTTLTSNRIGTVSTRVIFSPTVATSPYPTINITNWAFTGTAINSVWVYAIYAGVTLNISNYTGAGNPMDFMWIRDIQLTAPYSTFYCGAQGRLLASNGATVGFLSPIVGFLVSAPVTNQRVYVLTQGTTWTVPYDFNSVNSIHLIGAGGGGSGCSIQSASGGGYSGAGGGGGGYTKVQNLPFGFGQVITYSIGVGGTGGAPVIDGTSSGGNGTATTFNSSAYTAAGGSGAVTLYGTAPYGGAGGVGATYTGGTGGYNTLFGYSPAGGGGGGGGAAGLNGNGGGGGWAFTSGSPTLSGLSGGGGGGNGGGSNGANAVNTSQVNGGNNSSGLGGGGTDFYNFAFNGGGGYGTAQGATTANCTGGYGSQGIDIYGVGGGGGGGGAGSSTVQGEAGDGGVGVFGGGGGGGGSSPVPSGSFTLADLGSGGNGGNGVIIIVYQALGSSGNFFFVI